MDNFIPFFQLVIIACALVSAGMLIVLGVVAILRYFLDVPLITKERIKKDWSFSDSPRHMK